MVGYTEKQAAKLRLAVERDMARIEDAAIKMLSRVTDHGQYVNRQLEELREVERKLLATIDHRTIALKGSRAAGQRRDCSHAMGGRMSRFERKDAR